MEQLLSMRTQVAGVALATHVNGSVYFYTVRELSLQLVTSYCL